MEAHGWFSAVESRDYVAGASPAFFCSRHFSPAGATGAKRWEGGSCRSFLVVQDPMFNKLRLAIAACILPH